MIAWFARNPVASNLLLFIVIVLGLHALSSRLVLEVFPEFERNVVRVSMVYRGATPSEVEQGLLIKIEEAIQDLPGIEELTSSASEGSGSVSIEVEEGTDPRVLLDDIKGRVDAINTFPTEAERPTYSVAIRRREVIGVVVYGELPERELRRLGEQIRDELLALPEITQVELAGVRPYEISIEMSELALERYGLTFDEVSAAVRRSSMDLPAGSLKTRGGEIRLRTKGQSYTGEDFAKLVVLRDDAGTLVTLGELAEIRDGFEEEPLDSTFNGEPCVRLEVYRVGKQNAITLAQAVVKFTEERAMPPGVKIKHWRDTSVIIQKRLDTLYRNALQGALLVAVVLGLFLRPSVAFWVCIGIPASFLGALAILPSLGVSLNLLSVFAFILVLGIVVDDAIVTGENIYAHIQAGEDPTEAVIAGTEEVAVPVTFGVLTTVVAFLPLAFMQGRRAPIFAQYPVVVIPVLLLSLIESKLILPSHLRHVPATPGSGPLSRLQDWISSLMTSFAQRLYQPVLIKAVWARYLTLAAFVTGLAIVTAQIGAGQTRFVFFPRIQSETARASILLPEGASFELTRSYVDRMVQAARELKAELIDPKTGESVICDVLATAGSAPGPGEGTASNVGGVMFELTPAEDRGIEVTTAGIIRRWREKIGALPGVREFQFRAEIGRGGEPIDIQLMGQDLEAMRTISERIKARLATYPGVFDIADSFSQGKPELNLKLRPEAEALGLSQQDLARQVRQGFFGADVQRIQRGRDDVRVVLRYPMDERDSLGHLETMKVRTASGAAVPFIEVAEVERDVGFASITRIDRRRVLNIRADIEKSRVDMTALSKDLRAAVEEIMADAPELGYAFKGEMEEQSESFNSLFLGLGFVLLATYILLAIPFKSYVQPLVVMGVIPFGWAGAVISHQLMDMSLSIFSVLGILALTGVVVNDSLVLVDFINRRREQGVDLIAAVNESGVARFRAILLTSLTTFAGLLPLIFEKSTQAQFLIPMAVSLGFGVMFATFVTLLLVPACYVILEDIKGLCAALWSYTEWPPAAPETHAPAPVPAAPEPAAPEPEPASELSEDDAGERDSPAETAQSEPPKSE